MIPNFSDFLYIDVCGRTGKCETYANDGFAYLFLPRRREVGCSRAQTCVGRPFRLVHP